jgi:hypothetical protein
LCSSYIKSILYINYYLYFIIFSTTNFFSYSHFSYHHFLFITNKNGQYNLQISDIFYFLSLFSLPFPPSLFFSGACGCCGTGARSGVFTRARHRAAARGSGSDGVGRRTAARACGWTGRDVGQRRPSRREEAEARSEAAHDWLVSRFQAH